jgi:transglutaminase-like putative cysteine protease
VTARFLLLVALCGTLAVSLVAYKVLALGYHLNPAANEERWSIQLTVRTTGQGEKARIHLALPGSSGGDQVYDESFAYPGMKLSIKTRNHGRAATFTSDSTHPLGTLAINYRCSAHLDHRPEKALLLEAAKSSEEDLAASDTVPADDGAVVARAKELAHPAADDLARVRSLYDFVVDEVSADREAQSGGASPALAALASHKGGPAARTRLFAALVRSLGIPARIVHAVPLAEGSNRPFVVRAEVLADGRWISVDPVRGRFGADADEGFVLARGDGELVRTEGLPAAPLEITVTRQDANEYALFQRRLERGERLLDRLSFENLPPHSQLIFRLILLVPLGALLVALFRNLVGVPTFGTFMPILIALALRETTPLTGLLLLGTVVSVGFLGRRTLAELRLLIVPRLSLLLTFVIFIMAGVALLAVRFDAGDGLSIAVLPMVILTMTIERLSVMIAEEGPRPALRTLSGTLLVAGVAYALFRSDLLQRVVFTFPELNLLVVAGLLLLGRYTGYRLSEYWRFRSLARRSTDAP